MKIMICGSMAFAKEMIEAQTLLRSTGHDVEIPCDTDVHVSRPGFNDDLEADLLHCLETDVMRRCFKLVEAADAIVVLNYPKNGINGYIGASTLMEMGLAYHFGKKIYLLNDLPGSAQERWAHEVRVFKPTILNGDLKRLL